MFIFLYAYFCFYAKAQNFRFKYILVYFSYHKKKQQQKIFFLL